MEAHHKRLQVSVNYCLTSTSMKQHGHDSPRRNPLKNQVIPPSRVAGFKWEDTPLFLYKYIGLQYSNLRTKQRRWTLCWWILMFFSRQSGNRRLLHRPVYQCIPRSSNRGIWAQQRAYTPRRPRQLFTRFTPLSTGNHPANLLFR